MNDLNWFTYRIGTTILRGSTEIKVTQQNYRLLHDMQDKDYLFTDPAPVGNTCVSCEG